ncbi:MAG TPA: fatty acyl-AMP ligase, partial [Ideonella sp.]|nr:fatty acyl-AMP ligase [Ideonella sp.]
HTHASLRERARRVAAGLQRAGLAGGESVALMLPTSLAFFEAFAGIVLAGGVPIPIYPPFRAAQIEDHLRRQAAILANGRAVLLISDARALAAARILRAGAPALRALLVVEQLLEGDAVWRPVPRAADDVALLPYTSGSTGQPKGVVLTHANLLANVRAMGRALEAGPGDVFVSWLPLYHDMGLIGAWMGTLYHGLPLVVMPPQDFLARPARWLRAIHRHGGTLSAAPNFAYEIVAAKVPDDELRGLDLSRWRVAANGAEPVHAATLARFAARFGRYGFDAHALMPMYGLAENGVGLAFPPLGRGPRIDRIDRRALHALGRAEPAAAGAEAMEVVGCGLPLAGHELRVVDTRGSELPDRHEGRIEFRGPSATSGYFRNPEATRALFRGDWLDTGDVGYVAEGEIFLTSRVKDLIIRGGHNIHPYDLEEAVGRLPGVREGCVAVFGAADPTSGTDRIVVLAETRPVSAAARAALRERIGELAIALLGAPADDIVLAPPRTVLKTSSGKI